MDAIFNRTTRELIVSDMRGNVLTRGNVPVNAGILDVLADMGYRNTGRMFDEGDSLRIESVEPKAPAVGDVVDADTPDVIPVFMTSEQLVECVADLAAVLAAQGSRPAAKGAKLVEPRDAAVSLLRARGYLPPASLAFVDAL